MKRDSIFIRCEMCPTMRHHFPPSAQHFFKHVQLLQSHVFDFCKAAYHQLRDTADVNEVPLRKGKGAVLKSTTISPQVRSQGS